MDNQEKALNEIKDILIKQLVPSVNELKEAQGSFVKKEDFAKVADMIQELQNKISTIEATQNDNNKRIGHIEQQMEIRDEIENEFFSGHSTGNKLQNITNILNNHIKADSISMVFNNDDKENKRELTLYKDLVTEAETSGKPVISDNGKTAIVPYYDNKDLSQNPIAFAFLKAENIEDSPFKNLSAISNESLLGGRLESLLSSIKATLDLEKQAEYDPRFPSNNTYGALNKTIGLKTYVENRLEPIFQEAIKGRDVDSVVIGFFDMNDFAICNELYAHLAGDEALQHTINIINSELRQSDALISMGGDEFAIIITSPTVAEGMKVLDRINDKVNNSLTPITADYSYTIKGEDGEEKTVHDIEEGKEIKRSISMGATYLDNTTSVDKNNMQSLFASCQGNSEVDVVNRLDEFLNKIHEADGYATEAKEKYHSHENSIGEYNLSDKNTIKSLIKEFGGRMAAAKVEQIIDEAIKTASFNISVPEEIQPIVDSIRAEKEGNVKVLSSVIDKVDGRSIVHPYLANDGTAIARMELYKEGVTENFALVVEGKATIVFDEIAYSTSEPSNFPPELVNTILHEGVSNLQVIPEKDSSLPRIMAYYDFTDKNGNKSELASEEYTGGIKFVDRALEARISEYAGKKMDEYIKEHNLGKEEQNKDVKKEKDEKNKDTKEL